MNAQYLILIEQLVRDGRSEEEIEAIVGRTVDEDAEILEDELDDLPAAA
jgi:deferrochelatase/peroxidase EfeB